MKHLLKISIICIFFPLLGICGENPPISDISIVTPYWERFTNKNGSGLYFDIVRAVYEPMGIRMNFKIVPWKRAKKLVYEGKADALLGEYREDGYLMPRYPLYVEKTNTLFKKGRIPAWNGPKNFVGKHIIWLRGYDYHEILAEELDIRKIHWDEVDTHGQAWRMINDDRADFYIDAAVDIDQYARKHHIDISRYDVKNVYTDNVYIEFTKSLRSQKLIHIYDTRIPKLLKSGRLKQIYKKWQIEFPKLKPSENK